jgi:site-specific recombinase XerD
MNTLESLVSDFLEHQRVIGRSPVHVRTVGYHLRGFVRWLAVTRECKAIGDVKLQDLEVWVRTQRTRTSLRRGVLKPASLNKAIVVVRTFLQWLKVHGKVSASIAGALVCIKEPRLLPQSLLTHRQARALLARAKTDTPEGMRDRTMWEVLYSTGARAAEILGLNVGDVDLAAATAIVTGKGNKQRIVPIGQTACRFLESYIKGVRPLLLTDPQNPALWLTHDGRRVSYPALRRRLAVHASEMALPVPVTPHTFRRSCTTELIRGGANLWHVKELLGHENLDTLNHYVRLTIADLKKTHARCHPREREST